MFSVHGVAVQYSHVINTNIGLRTFRFGTSGIVIRPRQNIFECFYVSTRISTIKVDGNESAKYR